jgi:hypothetical protein
LHPTSRPRGRISSTIAAALLVLTASGPLLAGSICGTVTDAVSAEPVAQAGVFLRTAAGAYTGDYAATDVAGHYCLTGLPAGTYTLEVLVDDYVVCYRTGVVVADDVTDVPIPASLPAVRLAPPWPNPSAGAAKLRVVVQRSAPVQLSVYDAGGRLLRTWGAASLDRGDHDFEWDALGSDGRPAPSGLYLVQARSEGLTSTRTLVLTR